ncbi:hypothetical protein MRQ36_01325 [Micromonospora sp. R77]|uniref:hypothetical protein n=1 Tax=Micromonospora sp. R77 TaxID=2925836 RepID=UPI001F626017|nr:hypothetical protein [Micromonospora sp. R77]MCI4061286.1 hypothetical protein [Micromonospora sp. R77]
MSIAESSYWYLTCVSPWIVAWSGYELISGERRDALPWILLIVSVAALIAGVAGLVVLKTRRN